MDLISNAGKAMISRINRMYSMILYFLRKYTLSEKCARLFLFIK